MLLEIDVLNYNYGKAWPTIGQKGSENNLDLFKEVESSEMMEALSIWQDAMEISYYDEVLNGINKKKQVEIKPTVKNSY